MNRSLETIVTEWVKDNSKVIDFGCGDGSLLKSLTKSRSIMGYGVENDPTEIHGCIKNGISVVQQDIDQGLSEYKNMDFDMAIMDWSDDLDFLKENYYYSLNCSYKWPDVNIKN